MTSTQSPSAASRILFTLGALLLYRLATYVPLPGLDLERWGTMLQAPYGRIIIDPIAGGAMQRLAITALGLAPLLNAAIIVRVVSLFLRKQDDTAINRRTRYLTVVLAMVQSYGVALSLESLGRVDEPGLVFRVSTVATLTGGTVWLMWLGDRITARGVARHGFLVNGSLELQQLEQVGRVPTR